MRGLFRTGSYMGLYSLLRSGRTLGRTLSCKPMSPFLSLSHPEMTAQHESRLTTSFSASLAGLLWRNILHQKGLVISQKEFIKWNTVPVIATMIVGCLVVAGEVCVMYKS